MRQQKAFSGRLHSNVFWAACALTLALGSIGCAPRQAGVDQIPDVNVAITELKDADVPGLQDEVDLIVNDYLAMPGGAPGCAVGVMKNNQMAGLEGYGVADIAGARPMTTATPSAIGSVSKTFTALGILRLQEMSYLDIDDPISDYVLGLPPGWQGITLRQLLSHQSGLARDPVFHPSLNTTAELNQFYGNNPPDPYLGIHPRLVYPAYMGTPFEAFPAGYDAAYSNTAYLLLGAVIDQVVTENSAAIGTAYASYESFVWRQVGLFDGNLSNADQLITPSLDTSWRFSDIPELAKGYRWDGADFVELSVANDSKLLIGPAGWEGPAATWSVTIGDLTRLMVALQNNDIISATTRDTEMRAVHGHATVGTTGLGVFVDQQLGLGSYANSGEVAGYKAAFGIWPTKKIGVAVMCNSIEGDIKGLANDIASFYIFGGPVSGGFPSPSIPGIGASVGDGTEPQLNAVLAQRLLIGLDTHESAQLQEEATYIARLAELDTRGCLDFASDTIAANGYSITAPYLKCFDTSSSPSSLETCVLDRTDELIRSGILGSNHRSQVESCLAALSGTP